MAPSKEAWELFDSDAPLFQKSVFFKFIKIFNSDKQNKTSAKCRCHQNLNDKKEFVAHAKERGEIVFSST